MKIREIQKKYNKKIPILDLDILIAHSIRKPKEYIYTHPEYHLSFLERIRLNYYLSKHRRGFPIAYITHHKEFYGLDFYVNKHVLIPRPETEMMVEAVINKISNFKFLPMLKSGSRSCVGTISNQYQNPNDKILLVDVGTGSGCIPTSIAANLKKIKYYNIRILATDISRKALRVAKKNAKKHGVNIKFLRGNLFIPIIQQFSNLTIEQFNGIIITANLPYLTEQQFRSEPSIQKEPKTALVADDNGIAKYKELLTQITQFKNIKILKYCNITIFLEINPSQSIEITSLIKKRLPSAKIQIKKDLAGRDRLIIIDLIAQLKNTS